MPELDHGRLLDFFNECIDTTERERALGEQARDYFNREQFTADEKRELAKRGQPVTEINRIRRKVEFLKGLEISQRTEPRGFPRTPQHEQDAEAATDSIRFVLDNNEFDKIRSMVGENLLIEGRGGADVRVEMVGDRVEVVIHWYDWSRLFADPRSMHPDYSDARYLGYVTWWDESELRATYKGKKKALDAIEAAHDSGNDDETYADRPLSNPWMDANRERVRVVTMYYLSAGKWYWSEFTQGGELAGGESIYLDEGGNSAPSLILQSMYVDRDNGRHGIVKDMIPMQDATNKRFSKLLHLLNSQQVIMEEGAVKDVNRLRTEIARPDGVIQYRQGAKLDIRDALMATSGEASLLQFLSSEFEVMGPNASMMGKGDQGQSGRAILAQQQGGAIEAAPFQDRLRDWSRRVYVAVWMRIRQFWTEERWIRVTDDERNVRFVGLNAVRPVRDIVTEAMDRKGLRPDEYQRAMTLAQQSPLFQAGYEVQNPLARMEVDIVLDEVPDQITIRTEAFEMFNNALPTVVQIAQVNPALAEAWVMLSPLRQEDKQRVIEALRGAGQAPEKTPEQQQLEAQMLQLEMAGRQADVRKTETEASKNQAQAFATVAETRMKAMEPVQIG